PGAGGASGEVSAAVHGGFVEMTGDHLVVLSDLAELRGDIDVPRAEAARRAAQDTLARDPDDAEAQAALARAETRLAVAQGCPRRPALGRSCTAPGRPGLPDVPGSAGSSECACSPRPLRSFPPFHSMPRRRRRHLI